MKANKLSLHTPTTPSSGDINSSNLSYLLLIFTFYNKYLKFRNYLMQYFRPSLNYHLSLRSLFFLFLRGRFRLVLIYSTCKKIVKIDPACKVFKKAFA